MVFSLQEIHSLEVAEDYPAAIDELEARVAQGHHDSETVCRLGFNLWYAIVEEDRLAHKIPSDLYRSRFVELLRNYEGTFGDEPDFCWAFGLGLSMFHYEFEGVSESEGRALLDHAASIDKFYASLFEPSELVRQYKGRGIFESYYSTNAEQFSALNPGSFLS